uniref:Uncharacterized protein n=1 Tax=Lepeophtheirus salmonis TaxID=72036 RepID=A0A0K2U8A6_LEPSM
MHLNNVKSHRRILKRRTYEEDSTKKMNSDDMIEKRPTVNMALLIHKHYLVLWNLWGW